MASVSYNGESIIWKIPVTNLSPFPNTNVIVSDVMSGGTQYASHTVTKGTFDPLTGVWTVGDMSGESTETLTITVVVTDITQAPFTNTATVTGSLIEANTLDNTFTQTVTVENCPPTGAGLPDFTGCLCIDVSINDTKCTKGVTEWRLIPSSVTNSTSYHWDQLTGRGSFTPIDPTLPITGAYDLFCVQGTSITQISCNVSFTIYPQLENKSIFDHTIDHVEGSSLTPAEVALLGAQDDYQGLTAAQIQAYCWTVIRNGDGVITSGIALDCNEKQDTRTFFECTQFDCVGGSNPCPSCPQGSLPSDVLTAINNYADYTPQIGDTVLVQHPNALSAYRWTGSTWDRWSCGCIYKISQDSGNILKLGTDKAPMLDAADLPSANPYPTAVTVTGAATKTVTITMSSGPALVATFTDIDTDTNTTYSFSIVGTDLVITPSTGVPITLTLPSGSGLSSVAVNASLVGDGTIGNPLGVVPGVTPGQLLTWNGTSWVAALSSEAQFAELYNISGDATQTGNINTAQFTNESSNGTAFTVSIPSGTITSNVNCYAKIHYTTSVTLTGLIDTALTARVLNSSIVIPNSITFSYLNSLSTVTMSKTFFVSLNAGDVISFEVEDAAGYGIKLLNTNLSVEYLTQTL